MVTRLTPPAGGLFGNTEPRTMDASRNSAAEAAVSEALQYMALQEPPCMKAKAQHDNGLPDIAEDGEDVDEQINRPKLNSGKPKSHLDVVAEYEANHGGFAASGVSLYDHVVDYFCNFANTPATEQVMAAVKRRSDELERRWMNGEVANPFA